MFRHYDEPCYYYGYYMRRSMRNIDREKVQVVKRIHEILGWTEYLDTSTIYEESELSTLLKKLQVGDTVVSPSPYYAATSVKNFLNLLDKFAKKKVNVIIPPIHIDYSQEVHQHNLMDYFQSAFLEQMRLLEHTNAKRGRPKKSFWDTNPAFRSWYLDEPYPPITIKEIAEKCHVDVRTIRRWMRLANKTMERDAKRATRKKAKQLEERNLKDDKKLQILFPEDTQKLDECYQDMMRSVSDPFAMTNLKVFRRDNEIVITGCNAKAEVIRNLITSIYSTNPTFLEYQYKIGIKVRHWEDEDNIY